MRRRVAPAGPVVALAAAALVAGCTIGSGAGSANGPLFVVGCNESGDFASRTAPACFALAPGFFAGDPVEDIAQGVHSNRISIHLQRTGNRIEINDTLTFEVQNAYEVARCLRGEINSDGTPNWDTKYVSTIAGVPSAVRWCERPVPGAGDGGAPDDGGAADGGATDGGAGGVAGPVCETQFRAVTGTPPIRIHLGPLESVRVHLVPLQTCAGRRSATSAEGARRVASAVEGWVDFLDFGSALQSGGLPSDFKVKFGERLQANFHVVLQDDRVLYAQQQRLGLIPEPLIGGALDGYFDFELERGRAAQPFP